MVWSTPRAWTAAPHIATPPTRPNGAGGICLLSQRRTRRCSITIQAGLVGLEMTSIAVFLYAVLTYPARSIGGVHLEIRA